MLTPLMLPAGFFTPITRRLISLELLGGPMNMRSRREIVDFKLPFLIKSIGRILPAGSYEVLTDEELIEGLSFPCYRRVGTAMMVPSEKPNPPSLEMMSIGSIELADAQRNDASAHHKSWSCK